MNSILVIDDDSELADAIAAFLQQEGYEVRWTSSGKEGLVLARQKLPGVLMLDWQMPQMSGQEVLLELESQKELQDIPLILMSAHIESIPSESLKRHHYLSKPFDADLMIELVARCLKPRAE